MHGAGIRRVIFDEIGEMPVLLAVDRCLFQLLRKGLPCVCCNTLGAVFSRSTASGCTEKSCGKSRTGQPTLTLWHPLKWKLKIRTV